MLFSRLVTAVPNGCKGIEENRFVVCGKGAEAIIGVINSIN